MASIRKHTFMVLAALGFAGCGEIINGYPPPNQAPRETAIELPDQILTVGRQLKLSRAENLFGTTTS